MSLEFPKKATASPAASMAMPGLVEAPQCGGSVPGQMNEEPLPVPVPASLMLTSVGVGSIMLRTYTSVLAPLLSASTVASVQNVSKTTVVPARFRPGLFDAELQPVRPVNDVSTS